MNDIVNVFVSYWTEFSIKTLWIPAVNCTLEFCTKKCLYFYFVGTTISHLLFVFRSEKKVIVSAIKSRQFRGKWSCTKCLMCFYYRCDTKIHTAFYVGAPPLGAAWRRRDGRVTPQAFGDNDVIIISHDCRVESQLNPLCSLGLRVATDPTINSGARPTLLNS